MDEKVQHMSNQLQPLAASELERGGEPDLNNLQLIRHLQRECLKLSDEKIATASEAYNLVKSYIQRLDEDMDKFAREIYPTGPPPDEQDETIVQPTKKLPTKKRKPERSSSGDRTPKSPWGNGNYEFEPVEEAQPEEELICYCKRPCFGEMVGCDNQSCAIEWFHFGCVGLKAKPKGKWYCQDCRPLFQTA
eukprot:TRINITY_DN7611_c0_g1_i2.p1 TRINITY_DN7611_c0_g1~~TRINITY_DN7611_c0_g1_i2.p1  ORF type:complete len:191 (+),score=39.46 TRINITY_DN7611_c0_g1_i2:49-621(+)